MNILNCTNYKFIEDLINIFLLEIFLKKTAQNKQELFSIRIY